MEMEGIEPVHTDWKSRISEVYSEIGKVVVGQQYMVSRLLMGLFTNGHILLEGVPGLAKTLTVNTLSKVLDLDFKRIQFTPDLLPSDLVGTLIYNQHTAKFEVKKGPVFANIILADEVNRSPAKVQSALLEAMQEKQVTIGETTFQLDRPFLVLATQNPVEQEGTYPLPEAQVDRFMLKIFVDYPTKAEEREIMKRMSTQMEEAEVRPLLSKEDIKNIRAEIDKVTVSEAIENYIVDLVLASRTPGAYGLNSFIPYIQFGASPRATINLHRAARAYAFLEGYEYVTPEHVKEVAMDVLRHRLVLSYEAEADGVKSEDIVKELLSKVSLHSV